MEKTEDTPKSANYHVPNLERALRVIEHLAKSGDGKGMNEIAKDLEIPKNSIYRITMTLLNNGYLLRDASNKKLTLSRKFLSIGHAALGDYSIIDKSMEVMRELRDVVNESVLLGTLLESEGVVLDQALGGYPFKMTVDAGTRFNIHASAPGKAILAYLPKVEREDILKQLDLKYFNERTITTIPNMRTELEKVRERGYAVDFAEEFDAIHCVGAPVLNDIGYPVASIWTTAPSQRIPQEKFPEYGELVRQYADKISAKLGYNLI